MGKRERDREGGEGEERKRKIASRKKERKKERKSKVRKKIRK